MSQPPYPELRALLAKATPGPWVRDAVLIGPELHEVDIKGPGDEDWYTVKSSRPEADANLICAARNALPGLLDEIDRLRAALDDIGSGELGINTCIKHARKALARPATTEGP